MSAHTQPSAAAGKRCCTVSLFGRRSDELAAQFAAVRQSGCDDVRLFVDAHTTIPTDLCHLDVTCLDDELEPWQVFLLAVAEQLMRHPQAQAHLLVNAGCPFVASPRLCANIAEFVEQCAPLGLLTLTETACGEGSWTAVRNGNADWSDAIMIPTTLAKKLITDVHWLASGNSDAPIDVGTALRDWLKRSKTPLYALTSDGRESEPLKHSNGRHGTRNGSSNGEWFPARQPRPPQRVAVVVPTWNCGNWLGRCLQSLRSQTVAAEIVVVDDASTDATFSVLEEFRDVVTVVRHARRSGANAARNTGVGAVSADFIAFADADNEYSPQWLEKLLDALCARPDVGVAYCGYTKIHENGVRKPMASKPWDLDELWYGNFIDMPSVVRRCAIPKEGLEEGFRPFDDWRLWLHMASQGWSGAWVPELLFEKWVRNEGKTQQSASNPWQRAAEIAALRRQYAGLAGLADPIVVVIPACGGEEWTTQCLTHLAAFSGVPIHIHYVDNGSALATLDHVARHTESLGLDLRIIRNSSNRGFTRAVNQGIAADRSNTVLILNNDCFVGPNCVENLAWVLSRSDRTAAVGPLTGDSGRQSLMHPERVAHAQVGQAILQHLDDPVASANRLRPARRTRDEEVLSFFCAMLSREAIDRLGSLDERFESGLAVDDEWCLRARKSGWQVKLALNAYAAHLHKSSFRRLGIDRDALHQEAKEKLQQVLSESG